VPTYAAAQATTSLYRPTTTHYFTVDNPVGYVGYEGAGGGEGEVPPPPSTASASASGSLSYTSNGGGAGGGGGPGYVRYPTTAAGGAGGSGGNHVFEPAQGLVARERYPGQQHPFHFQGGVTDPGASKKWGEWGREQNVFGWSERGM
jgi:hypothetical protein